MDTDTKPARETALSQKLSGTNSTTSKVKITKIGDIYPEDLVFPKTLTLADVFDGVTKEVREIRLPDESYISLSQLKTIYQGNPACLELSVRLEVADNRLNIVSYFGDNVLFSFLL